MSVAEQFAGLNIQSLISGPLTAAADASISLARSTADFINDVGFDVNGKIRTADFGYQRRTVNEDGTSNLEEMKVAVPMLAIVPIPNLQIDEVNILFDMEVKQSEKSESAKDLSASVSGSAKFGPIKVNITGSVSSHESNTRSSDNSAKYHVDVRATNHGTPEGLSRVLDMMAVCISPMLVSSDIKDGNGQALPDNAKAKAENLKRLRAEIQGLENRLDASRNSLDSTIQRMKNLAVAQQNTYQAELTRYLNTLDRTKAEDDAKADAASAAMDEVNLAWTNFRNQAAELVKVLADSNPGDNKAVSELFGLVSLKSKEGTTGKYDTSESQYSALLSVQGSVVEAQKNYDSAEADLLAKKIEYNNAVSGAAPAIADNGQQNANTTPPPQNTNGGANGKR